MLVIWNVKDDVGKITLGITDSDLSNQEESPSCCKTVFHLTNGRSNARESATEIRLL